MTPPQSWGQAACRAAGMSRQAELPRAARRGCHSCRCEQHPGGASLSSWKGEKSSLLRWAGSGRGSRGSWSSAGCSGDSGSDPATSAHTFPGSIQQAGRSDPSSLGVRGSAEEGVPSPRRGVSRGGWVPGLFPQPKAGKVRRRSRGQIPPRGMRARLDAFQNTCVLHRSVLNTQPNRSKGEGNALPACTAGAGAQAFGGGVHTHAPTHARAHAAGGLQGPLPASPPCLAPNQTCWETEARALLAFTRGGCPPILCRCHPLAPWLLLLMGVSHPARTLVTPPG